MGGQVSWVQIEKIAITDSDLTSGKLSAQGFSSGRIFFPPDVGSVTELSWYASPERDGTYVVALDADGAPITSSVAVSTSITLPPSLIGTPWLRMVADSGGSMTVEVSLTA